MQETTASSFTGLDPAGAEPRALTAEPATIFGWGAFSPDGRQIAGTANNRHPAHADPVVIDLATGAQRRVTQMEGPHSLRAWHPAGTALTVGAEPRTFQSSLFAVDPRQWRGPDADAGGRRCPPPNRPLAP